MRKREKKKTDKESKKPTHEEGERTKTDWQCEREREQWQRKIPLTKRQKITDNEKKHWQREEKPNDKKKNMQKNLLTRR